MAAHEAGVVCGWRVATGASEEHELDAAIDDRHWREPRQRIEVGEALQLLPHGFEFRLAHAQMHVKICEAAHPRCRAVFDDEQLRHLDGAVLPRHKARRQGHIVELQRIGVIGHDRHAVNQVERGRFIEHGVTSSPAGAGPPAGPLQSIRQALR
jgi:hypothetical protein